MKALFVDPKGVWEGLNNGIAYIASAIRDTHAVRVIDFVNKQGNVASRISTAKDADIVGISIKSFTLDESVMIAKKIRALHPAATIIAGGPHIIVDGYNFMQDHAVFDLAVKGEAELVFQDIVSGAAPHAIEGVIYRENGTVIENPTKKWIADLDALPFPRYDDFDSVNTNGVIKPIDNWPLVTSRGCPYSCSYCFHGDMLVQTDRGAIKIKDIEQGMNVITDKGRWRNVARTFEHTYSGRMIKIHIEGKEPIIATPNHKIKALRNTFLMLPAEELKAGDTVVEILPTASSVVASGNQVLLVQSTPKEKLLTVHSTEETYFSGTVYNLEIEEDHTYTINGIAVSNCNVPAVIGRKFRTRSGENILAELRYAQAKYRSNEFKVLDDNFTLLMDRAKDICQYFIDEKMDMRWSCPNGIRADKLDEELCTLMKKAGCYSMSIGVESGDPDVFEQINKGEKLADVEHGIRMAQSAGIQVHGFFIIGLVGSTAEADKRSIEFAKRVGISASWGILVPYPGTPVWGQVLADPNVRMLRDWKEGFHIGARPKVVFDTPEYPAEERVKMYYYANMSTIKKRDIPRAAKMIIKGLIAGK